MEVPYCLKSQINHPAAVLILLITEPWKLVLSLNFGGLYLGCRLTAVELIGFLTLDSGRYKYIIALNLGSCFHREFTIAAGAHYNMVYYSVWLIKKTEKFFLVVFISILFFIWGIWFPINKSKFKFN